RAESVPAKVADASSHPEPPALAASVTAPPPADGFAESVAETLQVEASASVASDASPAAAPASSAAPREPSIGTLTLRDILAQLAAPGRGPGEDLPPPVFKQGIIKLEDLAPGMELTGTVLNVVDFGCFVDIGMHDSGLVHVSRLADRFIRDPHEVVAVGDVVHV